MRVDVLRERDRFAAAVTLLTRLPIRSGRHDPDWLPRSAKYFPLVGGVIGSVAAAVLVAAASIWPTPIPEIVAVGSALILTGALHEDGLADTADSFGGATIEHRLAIMKDSRLGTYGALALATVIALQLAAIAALPTIFAAASLIAAHAGARLAAVLVLASHPYAGKVDAAKLAAAPDRMRNPEILLASAFAVLALLPALIVSPGRSILAVCLGSGVAACFAWRACCRLGGQTGDVLGASAVVFMTGFLVGAAASPGWSA